jgi:hypothetical protein
MNDPKNDIDIAEIDTKAGRHWLHPSQRFRADPKLAAIRAKYRAMHRAGQHVEKMAKAADDIEKRLDDLEKP